MMEHTSTIMDFLWEENWDMMCMIDELSQCKGHAWCQAACPTRHIPQWLYRALASYCSSVGPVGSWRGADPANIGPGSSREC